MKKTWEAPKLIILVRGRAQERILSACKSNEVPTGPNANVSQCEGGLGQCPNCLESVTT
jgi:hypothetical protein